MLTSISIPRDVCLNLNVALQWLTRVAVVKQQPLSCIAYIMHILASSKTPLDGSAYRKIRAELKAGVPKATQLFGVLLLHHANEPDDTLGLLSVLALFEHAHEQLCRDLDNLIQQATIKLPKWLPAAGPPWPGASRVCNLWALKCPRAAELAVLQAGLGSAAPETPYSGYRAAYTAALSLEDALGEISPTPPPSLGTALYAFVTA